MTVRRKMLTEAQNPSVTYRPIPSAPGYLAGSDGSIWSTKYGAPRRLRSHPDRDGYLQLATWVDRRQITRKVHHLVLEAFVGPCPPGLMARHLNDVPGDNAIANLAWGTGIENSADKLRNGRSNRGSRHGNAKLTEADVIEIRAAYARGERRGEIAKRYPAVRPEHLWAVAHDHRRWPHLAKEAA